MRLKNYDNTPRERIPSCARQLDMQVRTRLSHPAGADCLLTRAQRQNRAATVRERWMPVFLSTLTPAITPAFAQGPAFESATVKITQATTPIPLLHSRGNGVFSPYHLKSRSRRELQPQEPPDRHGALRHHRHEASDVTAIRVGQPVLPAVVRNLRRSRQRNHPREAGSQSVSGSPARCTTPPVA